MDIQEETVSDILVLSPKGRIDSQTAGQFEEILMGKIQEGMTRLVIDFSDVAYISSAGLRVVLMAAKRCKGSFAICHLADHIKEVFEISGFLKILSCLDTRDQALATF